MVGGIATTRSFGCKWGDCKRAWEISMARIAQLVCESSVQIIFTALRCTVGDDAKAVVCNGTVSPRKQIRPLYESTPIRFTTSVECARGICRVRESRRPASIVAGGSFGFAFGRSVISRPTASRAGRSLKAIRGETRRGRIRPIHPGHCARESVNPWMLGKSGSDSAPLIVWLGIMGTTCAPRNSNSCRSSPPPQGNLRDPVA